MLYLWSKNGDFEKYDLTMQLCSGQRGHLTPKSNSYMHFLIETKKSELDKMCVINVVVIAYKNINYYKSSGLK